MITPFTVVRVTEVMALNGDRATAYKPAYEVTIWKGEKSFVPQPGPLQYNRLPDGPCFSKEKAYDWARFVAYIIDAPAIQLFKMQNGVEVFQEDLETQ